MSKRQFTDAKGRTWDVTLTLGGARRIDASDFSELTDKTFSMLRPGNQLRDLLLDVLTDTPLLFAMIWAVVQPQARELGIEEDGFLEGLDGPTIQAGREAFWGAVSDFFPEHRTALSMLLEKYQAVCARAAAEIRQMGPMIETILAEAAEPELAKMRRELAGMTSAGSPGATS